MKGFTLRTLFLVSVTFLLFSCSKAEIVKDNNAKYISFRPNISRQSRAIEEKSETLNAFNVSSIIKEGRESDFYFSSNIKKGTNQFSWISDGDYYFVPNKTLSFFAYANIDDGSFSTEVLPHSESMLAQKARLSISEHEQIIADYSPAKDVAKQKDVLVAYKEGTSEDFPDGTISLNFKHILSQIEVFAYCANPLIKIEVTGVQIANVLGKAHFSMPAEETTSSLSLEDNWDYQNINRNSCLDSYTTEFRDSQNGEISPISLTSNKYEKYTSLTGDQGTFMLIPQKLKAWDMTKEGKGSYIAIKCRILSKSNIADKDWSNATQLFPAVEGEYAYTAVPLPNGQKWQPGKKYIYNLEFCNPETGAGGGVRPDNPNKPILGNVIKFGDISVEEWDSL